MCGITGWVDWKRDLSREDDILLKMTNSLSHRGPDAVGTWMSPRAALGHRRLVVVDPLGGQQPMVRSRGNNKYVITYNGELYNTLELRRELEARGHRFQTRNSDTEVLLMAYIEWGSACLARLNGIYAFAIWDDSDQSLFLARDRLGVKPLFYCHQGASFIFGSEIKALLAHPEVFPQLDPEGLMEVLVMSPARTPGIGIFRGIRELRPGCCLRYDQSGIHIERYWSLVSEPHDDDLNTTARRVRQLLQDAVKRQLVSDVPLATLLSGGIDSSAITAFAVQGLEQKQLPLRTFSVDYVDNDQHFRSDAFQPDHDSPWVKRVAEYCGTEHRTIVLSNRELADSLMDSMRSHDLPGMADIDSSLYLFCREIRKLTTVCLSGECADEVLGGYPWFSTANQIPGFPWFRSLQKRWEMLSCDVLAMINPEEYLHDRWQEACNEVPGLPGETTEAALMRQLTFLNITRFMPTLLDRKDRMSMAWGLEIRVPFADHRLVEYAWNIPWEMKRCDNIPKGILRRALHGVLPRDVLYRPKSPYPKTHNPIYYYRVRNKLKAVLDDPNAPIKRYFNVNTIRKVVDSGVPIFPEPWFGQLMGDAQYMAHLLQINGWLSEYKVFI